MARGSEVESEGRSSGAASPPWIALRRGEHRLVVPVRDGVADLTRGIVLNGSAGQVLEAYEASGSFRGAVDRLVEGTRIPRARAEADVRSLVEDLVKRGILDSRELSSLPGGEARTRGDAAAVPTGPRALDSGSGDDPGATVTAEDLEALIRAALAEGRTVRFRARGLSMRPSIPHGSVLEVVPAAFDAIPEGAILLYGAGVDRLVAHRLLRRDGDVLLTRGDSSARVDRVTRDDLLGRVTARIVEEPATGERRIDLEGPGSILRGRVSRTIHRVLHFCGALGIAPLRASFGRRSVLRSILQLLARGVSSLLLRMERWCFRARRPIDELRAALLSTKEKDERRRRLYGAWAVQEFTALDENVRAGLTLIEEVALSRHDLPGGTALVLGCGPGREALVLAERGFEVVGIDWQEEMLERGRQEARRRGLSIEFHVGEADAFDLKPRRFDLVVVFSGLYNMLLPRRRRIALLERSREHLKPEGRIVVTFLSAYVPPAGGDAPPPRSILRAMNPEHEPGDFYLINEAVHVFPRVEDLVHEVREAGLRVEASYRDQRAYDRVLSQVKGYVILGHPG